MKCFPRPAAAAALLVSSLVGTASAQNDYRSPTILPPANQSQARFYQSSYPGDNYPNTNLPSAIADSREPGPMTTLVGAPRDITPIQAAPSKGKAAPHQRALRTPLHKGAQKGEHQLLGKGHAKKAPWSDWSWDHLGLGKSGKSDAGKSGCRHCPTSCWYAGAYGLLMTRDREDHYMFSYDTFDESIQLTDSRDADMGWAGGFELRGGRYFDCGTKAMEVVYWGLFPDSDSTVTTSDAVTGSLNGILNWDQLDYNGFTADTFVNNAEAHAVFRDIEVHNVEYNLVKFCGYCGSGGCSCSRLRYQLLAGLRYFKFDDDLSFAADTVDRQFTGAVDELYYNISTENNLIGFQIGGEGEYALNNRLNFDFGVKLGLFANYIEHRSEIGGAAGRAVINNGPNNGVEFLVDNSKDDISMLGEVKLGLEYCLSNRWTATVGYRAVAVTGVALPTDQIYPDLRGIQDVLLVDSNGSLILHGAYLGAEYNF